MDYLTERFISVTKMKNGEGVQVGHMSSAAAIAVPAFLQYGLPAQAYDMAVGCTHVNPHNPSCWKLRMGLEIKLGLGMTLNTLPIDLFI